jgi:hypothetical protein
MTRMQNSIIHEVPKAAQKEVIRNLDIKMDRRKSSQNTLLHMTAKNSIELSMNQQRT